MNKNTFYQQCQILVVLLIMVFFGAHGAYAAGGKGATLKVTMKDGLKFNGELLSVSDQTLLLFNRGSLTELKVAINDLKDITVVRKPNGIKRVINGTLLGIISWMTVNASNDDYIQDEYKGMWLTFYGVTGGVLGSVSILAKKSRRYDITHMSTREIEALLGFLSGSSRENRAREDSYKDGLIKRVRLSWRPYFKHQMPQQDIWGNFKVGDNSLPGKVLINSSDDDRCHIGRIRVDYALRNWLSLGFEFVSLGKHYIRGGRNLHIIQDQQDYYSPMAIYGSHKGNVGLIGVNLEIPAVTGFRLETGIGLSLSRMKVISPGIIDSYRMVKPAFQLGMSMDFYPRDLISLGIYATYLYSHASFKEIDSIIRAEFVPNIGNTTPRTVAFTREVIIDIPRTDFNIGGFSLGFVLCLR